MSTAATPVIPFPVEKSKRPMPGWTPERRRKMEKAWARRRKERAAAEREERRQARKGRKTIAAPRAAPAGKRSLAERTEDATDRAIAAATGRKGRTAGEERADAIVYLRAATERIAHATDAELLALLALRRLQGRIK